MQKEDTENIVSVSMLTYNQKHYIAQAVESVLMQKAEFVFEIVLGDDCSTDGTREICKKYANRFPDIIKLRLPEENLGFIRNMRANLKACKGKYIAILEGDDYWTDPYKLQKQVDFLENHPDSGLVCTDFEVINNSTGEKGLSAYYYKTGLLNEKVAYSINDLLKHNFVGSPTAVFRNDNIPYNEILLDDYKTGDYPIWLYLSLNYSFYYLSDVTAVYRYIPGSLSHLKDDYNALKFGMNIEAIRYRFAKIAGIDQMLVEEYVKMLKYQLEEAFQHSDKVFYSDALNRLSGISPQTISKSHIIRKLIVKHPFLVQSYCKLKNLRKRYFNIKMT